MLREPQAHMKKQGGSRYVQVFEFSGQRQLIGYPMEARKMVRAPVREMRAEISVISACYARTMRPSATRGED